VADQLYSEGLSDLGVSERIEVSPIKGEGPGIRTGSATGSQIVQGCVLGAGPGLSIRQSGSVRWHTTADQVAMKGQKAEGDFSPPPAGCFGHALQHQMPFWVRHPRYSGFSASHIGQQLGLVSQWIEPSAQPCVQGDMLHQSTANSRRQALRPEVSLDIGDQGPVEVVHGDKDDGEVGLVCGHRLVEEPAHHSRGVAGLACIDDLDVGVSLIPKGIFGHRGDALVVSDSPAKDGGVSHDGDPIVSIGGIHRVGCPQAMGVGADSKVMRLLKALHRMVAQVGIHGPSTRRVWPIGGRDSRQTGTDFGEPQKGASNDKPQASTGQWRKRTSHGGHLSRMLLFGFLVGLCGRSSWADVEVRLAVSVVNGVLLSDAPGAMTAKLRWLGEDREVPLTQTEPDLWTASLSGPAVRTLGVEVWLMDRSPPRRVSQNLEVMSRGDASLAWTLGGRRQDVAWRMSEPIQAVTMRDQHDWTAIMGASWTFLSVLLVLVLGRRALARGDLAAPVKGRSRWGLMVLAWMVFAVLWTWPAILAGPDIVGRHFDALGTVWVIDAATRLGFDLYDPATAWPLGVSYLAIDSWLLLPLAWLGSAFDPAAVHGLIAVVGVASSGLAAAVLARGLGAERPFDIAAGILFACSGLAAAALLEGHVYQVVNPWMPLMALCLYRTGGAHRPRLYGGIAGLCFGLALFSSGYLGLSAGLVALGFGLPLLVRGPREGVLIAGVIALSFGLVYLFLIGQAGPPDAFHASPETVRLGSLTLGSLGPATAEIDRTDHSLAFALSAAVVALGLIALSVRARASRSMALIVVVSILVALGPEWSLTPGKDTLVSPLGFLWDISAVQYFRFPGRILWAGLLGLSVGAALGLTVLARRLGRRFGIMVMAMVVLEVLLTVRLPVRQRVMMGDTPTVYASAEGPVFDLVGEGINQSREVDAWMSAILCQYQTHHKRPIAEDCVAVGPDNNPRIPQGRWVYERLVEGDVSAVTARLAQQGFTSLAVHYDWFDASDRIRLQAALVPLAVQTEDAIAEGVAMYAIAPVAETEEAGPSREGLESSPMDWRLRVDLVSAMPEGGGRFFVEVASDIRFELKDRSDMPGAQPKDGIYSGSLMHAVDGAVSFRLLRIKAGVEKALWSGTVVPLDIDEDLLTFRMDGEARVRPALRAPDIFSPEVPSRGPQIRGLAWLASFILMGLWWLKVSRRD
jgi:hypothetical protein